MVDEKTLKSILRGTLPFNTDVHSMARELLDLRASHRKLMEASKRGSELLQAVCDFIEQNPVSDYTVRYDEAICDAYCLKDDCQICYQDIEDALAEARKVQP